MGFALGFFMTVCHDQKRAWVRRDGKRVGEGLDYPWALRLSGLDAEAGPGLECGS